MPSLTSVPITCPAAHTSAVRQLPSARLAPNMLSAISSGQALADSCGMSAELSSEPMGWWCRLCTLVLAQPTSAAWSWAGKSA